MRAESQRQKMQRLRLQAEQALKQSPPDAPAAQPNGIHDLAHALEDLRIYQVELELQNDELMKAQREAQVSSARHQLLFECLPMPAFVVDDQARVHSDNTLARDWLQKPNAGPLEAFRLLHSLLRSDRPRLQRAIAYATTRNAEIAHGLRLVDAQEQIRLVDLHVTRLPDDFHADPRYTVLVQDRSAEAARETDRQLFQSVLDSSDDLIYASDLDNRIILANRSLLNLVNTPMERVVGHKRETFLPLRDAIVHEEADRKVVESGHSMTLIEEVHGHQPGGAQQFMTVKFPLHDQSGNLIGVGGISRDMTAELESQRWQRMSEAVFMNTTEAIIVADADNKILRVNPAFEKMSGFSASTVVGHSTRMLRSGRHDEPFYRDLWDHLKERGHWEGEITNRTARGSFYTVWNSISAIHSPTGEIQGYIAVQTDLTALRTAQSEVARMASYDPLTGLPNRSLLLDRVNTLLSFSERQKNPFGVMFVDLDHFKEVNDTLGHQVGDELLKAISERLQSALRKQDTVARVGGDEFVVLLPATEREACLALAHKISSHLQAPMALQGLAEYRAQASLGLAMYPEDGQTIELLLRNADTAMYAAKANGRNRTESYSEKMSVESARQFSIQTGLAQGIANGELRLHFQPKFRLADMAVVGAEVLVRWQRPGNGLIGPGEFIPVAEKSGLIHALDAWVLEESLQTLHRWVALGLWPDSWQLSLNQTAPDLQQEGYTARLGQRMKDLLLPAHCLEIELNESVLVNPSEEMLGHLHAMRTLGVALSIDDFGTGYSSLSYLKALPVSVIKIDQSFVRDMLDDENDRVLVEAMITLAHKLNHVVVAEGVETDEQRLALHRLGCEYGQGYLLSPAVPVADFETSYLKATQATTAR